MALAIGHAHQPHSVATLAISVQRSAPPSRLYATPPLSAARRAAPGFAIHRSGARPPSQRSISVRRQTLVPPQVAVRLTTATGTGARGSVRNRWSTACRVTPRAAAMSDDPTNIGSSATNADDSPPVPVRDHDRTTRGQAPAARTRCARIRPPASRTAVHRTVRPADQHKGHEGHEDDRIAADQRWERGGNPAQQGGPG